MYHVFSAENGGFIKFVDPGNADWVVTDDLDVSWKPKVLEIIEYYTERTPGTAARSMYHTQVLIFVVGSVIEHKELSITWNYRRADASFGPWQAKQCQTIIQETLGLTYPIHVIAKGQTIEVRFT